MTWAEAEIMAPQYWAFAEWAGFAFAAFVVALAAYIKLKRKHNEH